MFSTWIFFTHGSTVNFSWPIGTNVTFKSYDVRTLRHFFSTLKNIIKIERRSISIDIWYQQPTHHLKVDIWKIDEIFDFKPFENFLLQNNLCYQFEALCGFNSKHKLGLLVASNPSRTWNYFKTILKLQECMIQYRQVWTLTRMEKYRLKN